MAARQPRRARCGGGGVADFARGEARSASPARAAHSGARFRANRLYRGRAPPPSALWGGRFARAGERRRFLVEGEMRDDSSLPAVLLHLVFLAFVSIGGINAAVPELHRQVVETNHWLSEQQFTDFFVV